MKTFLFAMSAAAALAAYAGDVANTNCAWTMSGYVCNGAAVASAVGAGESV